MDKQDNFLVNKFLKQISKIIDHKLEKLTTVESAIVDQINIDGSVNLHIPPDSTIFTGIQNQSIYQNLKVGDCVKVLKQNNKASNMWIIGGHNLKRDNTRENTIEETLNKINYQLNRIYTLDLRTVANISTDKFYSYDDNKAYRYLNTVSLTIDCMMNAVSSLSSWNSFKLCTLPLGYRPIYNTVCPLRLDGNNKEWIHNIYLLITSSGEIMIVRRAADGLDDPLSWTNYSSGHGIQGSITYITTDPFPSK